MRGDLCSDYGLGNCWVCLCEVCTRVGCPKDSRYLTHYLHCNHMRNRGSCPTVKCDWFDHRQKHRVYYVKSHRKRKDNISEQLSEILKRLDRPKGNW